MATVAQVIARSLARAGVRYVFGHPGGEVAHLIEALRREGIPFVLTRHEATAAFMAASWGELSGQPGVCLSTLGPGATNLLSGVAHAFLDRCPLVAITAQLATSRQVQATHQHLDLAALYAPVTKATITVGADTAGVAVERALYLAMAERPGPVHLIVPSNVASQESPGPVWDRPLSIPARPGVDPAAIEAAGELLARAHRPAVLVGIGAVRCGASEPLRRLAEALRAPVVTTPKAKGILPEDHPLAAGVLDMTGDAVVDELLREADLLVTAGLDVVELIKPWTFEAPVVHLDTVPNVERLYAARLEVIGDVAAALAGLAERARPSAWAEERLRVHRQRLRAALTARVPGLAPQTVMEIVREVLPRNGVVACDVGAHKILLGQVWTAYEPRTYLVSNGLSSMGAGLPGALAARLWWPKRPVVAIIGDGGFGMYLGELETAVRLGVALPIVVLVDGSLSLIKLGQLQRGYLPSGVDFGCPRLAEIARGFGAVGVRVETAEAVRAAMEQALGHSGITVIEAIVDAGAYSGGE
ncbi:MAG TPA: thiamine pyrophosphate-binding protein [Isosphaeraceae bacterium]|nr:thiamine pyrophosphate-binding protein [Isosphaeraceae bacterium]